MCKDLSQVAEEGIDGCPLSYHCILCVLPGGSN